MALLAWCLDACTLFVWDNEHMELCTEHTKENTGSVL